MSFVLRDASTSKRRNKKNQIFISLALLPIMCTALAEPIAATCAKIKKKGSINGESMATLCQFVRHKVNLNLQFPASEDWNVYHSTTKAVKTTL